MKDELLGFLCCPACRADLELRKARVWTGSGNGDGQEEVAEGVLGCTGCGRAYPVLDGIPRLCEHLWEEEVRALGRFRRVGRVATEPRPETPRADVYVRIEELVRRKLQLPDNASRYLEERVENDVYFRVRGCERQEKYVNTLRLHCDAQIRSVLDVGGGQGGLMKCLGEHLRPSVSVLLDRDLSWLDVARLRNPGAEVVRADAAALPFKRSSMDLVISQSLLEHVEDHDKALAEMCEVARETLFVCFGPNKPSVYDFGHLDAPVTVFPKSVRKYVAILWHRVRRTGRSTDSIVSELDRTWYISTSHVRKILERYGEVRNVFRDFVLFSAQSDYAYGMGKFTRYLRNHPSLMKSLCDLLVWLRVEPQSYYILRKVQGR
ncbi:MAG: methyltransferase domain-containing protein [Candidatus Brocadiae bacterium]|nr:methyltransferase domain-containing protein [Candidatus Brocadiia bacterium]